MNQQQNSFWLRNISKIRSITICNIELPHEKDLELLEDTKITKSWKKRKLIYRTEN